MCNVSQNMLLFSSSDFDAEGNVRAAALAREVNLFKPRFVITPELVRQLYLLAQAHELQLHTERIPEGKYIEVQVGRSVEDRLGFRFIS